MVCTVCGEKIKVGKADNGEPDTELNARADHLAIHNASPAQWTEAHRKIEAAKPKKGMKE